MAKEDDLIDSHVSLSQCRKAVEALHSHQLKKKEKYEENQILPAEDQHVWLNVIVKMVAPTNKVKPHKIPIIHPLVDPRTTSVCLITKDPQREYKDLLESQNIKFISRVVGIAKLKGKFKPFEARRMLLKENGMFLADQRIIPLLPKLLGSKWFEAKKQPIPVSLTRKDLKGELEKAISSTYMHQNRGTCTSVKVGKLSQTPSQILDNIKTALPAIVNAVPAGWDNMQSLHIKTNSSVSLPIWSCSLDDTEGGRWHGTAKEDEAATENGEDEASVAKNTKESKSRKRSPADDDEEEEQEKEKAAPRKKAKLIEQKRKAKDGMDSVPESVSPLKSSKPKKSPNAASEQPTSVKKGKAREPTLVTISFPRPNDIPPEPSAKSSSSKTTRPAQVDVDSKTSKRKLSERKDTATSPPTAKVSKTTSKEESRPKHSSVFLEKKKRLMAKAKGGRSIKNAFLGKKVAQG